MSTTWKKVAKESAGANGGGNPLLDPEVAAELRVLEHQKNLFFSGSLDVDLELGEDQADREVAELAAEAGLTREQEKEFREKVGERLEEAPAEEAPVGRRQAYATGQANGRDEGLSGAVGHLGEVGRDCPSCSKRVCLVWNYRRGTGTWHCLKTGYIAKKQ